MTDDEVVVFWVGYTGTKRDTLKRSRKSRVEDRSGGVVRSPTRRGEDPKRKPAIVGSVRDRVKGILNFWRPLPYNGLNKNRQRTYDSYV